MSENLFPALGITTNAQWGVGGVWHLFLDIAHDNTSYTRVAYLRMYT